ncbi:lipopolysaccharide kinase InaA family protein [Hyphomonas sp.]|uniref:ORC-CDC6 family AAA ATPase n=1 Tax=Hyphomonas sp. TaxID=87 RepID=UPI003D2D2924
MMQTSEPSGGLNQIISEKQDVLDLLSREDILNVLEDFDFNWVDHSANQNSELYGLFVDNEWIEAPGTVSRIGTLVYSRLALQLKSVATGKPRSLGNYAATKKIRSGKNSVVFEGKHRILGSKVVLKLLRPGASDDIEASLRRISSDLGDEPDIIMPTDLFDVVVQDVLGNDVSTKCLVFPFIRGQTFSDFLLSEANHYNSHIAITFIDQVGTMLASLERLNAYHGDLHADNILVDQAEPTGLRFKLIDLSYDAVGSLSLELSKNRDLEFFKQHIWSILSAQKSFLPHVSLRKFIGTEFFDKISLILSDKIGTFEEAMRVFNGSAATVAFKAKRTEFLQRHFSVPKSFRLQRYEEFSDPSVASRLFVPFEELKEKIDEFGNVFVSGNRGSGKSTYLASLAFFPSVDKSSVDFRETFGIYFPCRQGEFKALGRSLAAENPNHSSNLLHLVILKVIRKTLELISEAIAWSKISGQTSYSGLLDYINRFIPKPGIVPIQRSLVSELDNIVTTVSRVELDCDRRLDCDDLGVPALLVSHDLIKFFEIVRSTFPALSVSKFHILYDDAGEPYVQAQVQRVINELMINSNPTYCVKLTAEKNTYCFETVGGKALENGHDYYEQDISYSLFIGSRTGGLKREKLEEYFRAIVNQRLEYFGYQSSDIREYLGDNKGGEQRLITYLAYGRRDAYYFGWPAVWNIADRIPRNLLELVSEIFAVGNIDADTLPKLVPIRDQDRAIKTISEKRLQSLSQISGSLTIAGKQVSLGRKLFDVTITIGSTFRTYLRADRQGRFNKNAPRIRQHLAIERNDLDHLDDEAELVLQKLVTFGVLDTSRNAVARDDGAKKPIYVLNRIYCPAFEIGYRRDDHLKLSRGKLEQLLLYPNLFLRSGTKKLRDSDPQRWNDQSDLFVSQVLGLDDE